METKRQGYGWSVLVMVIMVMILLIPSVSDTDADPAPVYGSSIEPYGGMAVSYDELEDGATYHIVVGGHVLIDFSMVDARGMETSLAGSGLITNYITKTIEGDLQEGCFLEIGDKTIALVAVVGVYGDLPIYGVTYKDGGTLPSGYVGTTYNESITFATGLPNNTAASKMYLKTSLASYGLNGSFSVSGSYMPSATLTVTGTPTQGVDDLAIKVYVDLGTATASYEYTVHLTIDGTFEVMFDANGGSVSGSTTVSVPWGESLTFPSATRTDHSLQGWFTQASGGTNRGTAGDTYYPDAHYTTVKNPITFYAQWVENVTPVTSISISGSSSVEVGQSVTLTGRVSPTDADNPYINWYVTSGSSRVSITSTTDTSTGGRCTIEGLSAGSATIRAEAQDGSGVYKTYSITVTEEVVEYSFTLNYNANQGSGAPSAFSTTSTNTTYSTSVSTVSPSRSGYTFLGWSTDPSDTSAEFVGGNEIALTPGTMTLYAVWEKIAVTWYLSFEANGGSNAPTQISAPVAGSSHTFTIPSTVPVFDGYEFKGWARSASSSVAAYQPEGEFVAYEQNSVLYAVWKEVVTTNTFILLFESGTSDAVSGLPGKIELVDSTATAEAGVPQNEPTRLGYKFIGWGENAGTSTVAYVAGDSIILSPGTKTLFAVWTQVQFSLNLDSNGGTTSNRTINQSGAGNVTITIPSDHIPERPGYDFQGWSTTSTGSVEYNAGATVSLTESDPHVTLYAVWTLRVVEVDYALVYDANQGTGGPGTDIETSTNGSKVTFTIKDVAPTREGYDFLGWSDVPTSTTYVWRAGDILTPGAVNTTIYAVWQIQVNTWTLTFNTNGGEFEVGVNIDLSAPVTGDSHVFTIPSTVPIRSGYDFMGWATTFDAPEEDIVGTPGNGYTANKKDTTLYAVWKEKAIVTVELTLDANGGSDAPVIYPVQATLPHKFTMPDRIPTRDGKRFLGWTDTVSGTDIVVSPGGVYEVVDKKTTLYAVWGDIVEDTFVLNFDANGGQGAPGRITHTGTVASYKFTIPDTGPTKEGFHFAGWSYDKNATSASIHAGDKVTVYSETTLYAVWSTEPVDEPEGMNVVSFMVIVLICAMVVFILARVIGVV